MSENRNCRLFWKAVPFSIKVLTDRDFHDYCNLKTEVIIVEREYLHSRSIEVDSDEYQGEENPGVQMGEPTGNTEEYPKEDPEEDSEEDSEEDPDEDPDETTN